MWLRSVESGSNHFPRACFGIGFGPRGPGRWIFALVLLGTGCVNLTPPWERVTATDAARDVPLGSGGQSVLVDASGAGGVAGAIDVGVTTPDVFPSGEAGGTTLTGAGGSGGVFDAETLVPDAPSASSTGGSGGAIDGPLAGAGGATTDVALDAPTIGSGGAGGSPPDVPLGTAVGGRGGSGGATTGNGGTGGTGTGTGGSAAGGRTGTGGAGTG
jgi:hypothetical protein